jgi:ATP-dependent RNA helicase RhlE
MTFTSLGLFEPLLRALADLGYTDPTPVQRQAIPAVLAGRDVIAVAQTGTGKTAGFALPLLQGLAGGPRVKANHIRALVLAPTRELAGQVAEGIEVCGKYLPLKTAVVYGGVKINPQMMRLRGGVDILVATPGRLLDLFAHNAVQFSQVGTLVLDEADRMLDLGFHDDIAKILGLLPKKCQNVLLSATFPNAIRGLADHVLHSPVRIDVTPRKRAAETVNQWVYEVDKGKKPDLLQHLLRSHDWPQVLVFTRTKNGADQLAKKLANQGVLALAIHGDRSQTARTRALADFKAGAIRVLVATDIASRGLDISDLSHVINVDLPKTAEEYIHRIGRTGRAGLPGTAISLVSADEVKLLAAIETLIGQVLVRDTVFGYIPKHSVPLTRPMALRLKRPKKPKQARLSTQDSGEKPAGAPKACQRTAPRKPTRRKP